MSDTDGQKEVKRSNDSPATLGDTLRNLKWKEVTLLFTLAGGAITGYNVFVGKASAAADAGIKPVVEDVAALKVRLATQEQETRNLRADVHEVQMDIRGLYKYMTTSERQPRLEKPPVDAGGEP